MQLRHPRLRDAEHLADLTQGQLLVVVEGDDELLPLGQDRDRLGECLLDLCLLERELRARARLVLDRVDQGDLVAGSRRRPQLVEGGDRIALIDTIEDTQGPEPQSALAETEMREALGDAISRLPEREKLVVTLYYYEELTLREIGEVLGVTESRVSQLHTKAILRLKARLAGSPAREPLER